MHPIASEAAAEAVNHPCAAVPLAAGLALGRQRPLGCRCPTHPFSPAAKKTAREASSPELSPFASDRPHGEAHEPPRPDDCDEHYEPPSSRSRWQRPGGFEPSVRRATAAYWACPDLFRSLGPVS